MTDSARLPRLTIQRFSEIAVLIEQQLRERHGEQAHDGQLDKVRAWLYVCRNDMNRFRAKITDEPCDRELKSSLFYQVALSLQRWRLKTNGEEKYFASLFDAFCALGTKIGSDEIVRFTLIVADDAARNRS